MIGPLFSWLKRNRAGAASGREAGRREVEAIEALRETVFVDREQAALHAQLARAPRDAGALFGLLQWHARRGERDEVEALAHVLWDETDAEGGLWKRAAALGRQIDPTNPLYGEDPFKTLSEQAAGNAAGLGDSIASLQLDALDLDFPESADGHAGETQVAVVLPHNASGAGNVLETLGASGTAAAAGKDWLSVQTGQLPSSVLSLNLDLDGKASAQDPSALLALFKQPSRPASALIADVTVKTPPTAPTPNGENSASGESGANGAPRRLHYRPLRGPARKRRNKKPTGK